MCEKANVLGPRTAVRFAFVGLAAALLAGCADSSRFMGDPLGNPFKSAQAAPAPMTGADRDMAAPSYAPRSPVTSRALPPPAQPSRDVARLAPSQHVASYEAPAHEAPALSSSYRAPRTERTGSIPAAGGHGSWSAEDGSTVIAATGETASVLGQRYNVPTDVLLRVNGFSSANDVRPGTRVTIPVYNAAGAVAPAHAEPARVAAEPEPRERKVAARAPSTRRESIAAHQEAMRHNQAVKREEAMQREKIAQRERATRQEEATKREQAAQHEQAAQREQAMKREQMAKQETAKQETAKREAAKHEAAKREQFAKAPQPPMHWVKGPAGKVAETQVPHGREKAMAKLKPAAPVQVAEDHADDHADAHPDARALRKAAKEQAIADQAAAAQAAKQQPKVAKVDAVPEKPVKVAKVEEPVRSAPPVDPTPTASLPPATDKVSANGGNPEFRWPAHGRIIQGFKTGGNDGINIAVPEGTSVKAAESGVVAYAGSEIKGFGNLVLIRHPNGYVSAYANNANIEVHRGEQVTRGQTIAKSGQSGNVASPQLHFELRKGSTPVDPTRYLAGL